MLLRRLQELSHCRSSVAAAFSDRRRPPCHPQNLGHAGRLHKASGWGPPQTGQPRAAGAEGRFLTLGPNPLALCCRIKPAPYPSGNSHAPSASGSGSNFSASPEEPAYDGPSTSGAHLAPVLSTVSYDPRKPTVKSK